MSSTDDWEITRYKIDTDRDLAEIHYDQVQLATLKTALEIHCYPTDPPRPNIIEDWEEAFDRSSVEIDIDDTSESMSIHPAEDEGAENIDEILEEAIVAMDTLQANESPDELQDREIHKEANWVKFYLTMSNVSRVVDAIENGGIEIHDEQEIDNVEEVMDKLEETKEEFDKLVVNLAYIRAARAENESLMARWGDRLLKSPLMAKDSDALTNKEVKAKIEQVGKEKIVPSIVTEIEKEIELEPIEIDIKPAQDELDRQLPETQEESESVEKETANSEAEQLTETEESSKNFDPCSTTRPAEEEREESKEVETEQKEQTKEHNYTF